MLKSFTRARWIAVGLLLGSVVALSAQEPAVFERGLNIIRGNLTMSSGDIVMSSTSDIQAAASQNLILRSALLSKTIRLNSITDSTTTSGDEIGFQSKPRAGVGGSQTMYGFQVGPSISDGIATTGSMIGGHTEVYLRGTSAGTIGGDVRGLQVELVTDDAGTRTVSGDVSGIRLRTAFSGTDVTGTFSAIKIEKPETQTNSLTYDAILQLTDTITGVYDDTSSGSGDTEAGFIKVLVNGNVRYIVLYSDAP